MDVLDLSRWQFGITTVYHFLFVPLTIGLSIIVAGFQTAWHRTRNPDINDVQTRYKERYGAGDYRPVIGIAYWTFRLMIGFGALSALLALAGLWLTRGRRLPTRPWFHRLALLGIGLPFLANSGQRRLHAVHTHRDDLGSSDLHPSRARLPGLDVLGLPPSPQPSTERRQPRGLKVPQEKDLGRCRDRTRLRCHQGDRHDRRVDMPNGGVVIVVGVDGSPAALEATAWAAREAALRHAPLRIVHAIAAWACETSAHGPYADVARWMRDEGTAILTHAAERAHQTQPGIAVETALLPGDPRRALIDASHGAELLVAGNHGLGGFRGLLVGSVALGITGRGQCAVAVIRPRPEIPRSEIVVGVDGSGGSAAAIAFAFAEAALRGTTLRAVYAAEPAITPPITLHAPTHPVDSPADRAQDRGQVAESLLAEAVAGWGERYSDVKLIQQVDQGHPVDVLRQASAGADLLVVGSRGRGGVSALLLGSVSHGLLYHAECPLVVVP